MKTPFIATLLALVISTAAPAAQLAKDILYVTQVPLPTEFVSNSIPLTKTNITTTMQSPLADTAAAGRGGALWICYADGSHRNLTAAAGYGGAVDAHGHATGIQGANGIAVQRPFLHWDGTKAIFSMVVGAPTSPTDTTVFYWQLYEITNFGAGQTPVITAVVGQPTNHNNTHPCYDTQGRIIFASDTPHLLNEGVYPQLDEYLSLPVNSGLWRLDRAHANELKQIIHAPSGAFSPFVDSFGRVMFVQWDHLSRDSQASADLPPLAGTDTYTQTANGTVTFAGENSATFTLATPANYSTYNFYPEPRNFTRSLLTGTKMNGNSFNQFFPWECTEDGAGHEMQNHVGRHEFSGSINITYTDDPNLVPFAASVGNTVIRTASDNFLQLTESVAAPGTYYAVNAVEFGTHGAGQIVSYQGGPAVNPEAMGITYVTPKVFIPNPLQLAPLTTAVNIYRSPTPLSDGTLLAVHTTAKQHDVNQGTVAAPLSLYDFRLAMLVPSGGTMIPDAAHPVITPPTSVDITYYVGSQAVHYVGPLWELDPVEVVSRTVPAQLTSSIAAVEQTVFDEEQVDAPTFQKYLRNGNLALVVNRNSTRRDDADKQQPFNLKVAWSATQTLGTAGKIYDIGWLQIFQADAIRGHTLGGAVPLPGRRSMPVPLHDTLAEMPTVAGAPAGAVKLSDDGSWAAIVPAGRALSWHLLDGAGTKSQIKERVWVDFAPGEVRTCAVCHGVNDKDQAGNIGVPTNKPEALRTLLQFWRQNHPPGSVQHQAAAPAVLKNAAAANLSVTRVGGSTGPASVHFTTADGTATAGTDYTATSGTLTWVDGDTAPKTITIPVTNTPAIGAPKTLSVTLSTPLYASLGALSSVTLTVNEAPFQSWLFTQFGSAANTASIAGDNADPDNDGLGNLTEYLLGSLPSTHPDAPPAAFTELIGGVPSFSLTFTRDPSHTGISYHAQYSTDLATWTNLPDSSIGTSGALDLRKASIPLSTGPKEFLRLQVTRP